MGFIELQQGDIFCTHTPMLLGRAINTVQRFWAQDNRAEYSHTGLIVKLEGWTYEALWTVCHRNIFEHYRGAQVLIGRNCTMDLGKHLAGWRKVRGYAGQPYPVRRLLHYLAGPLAKYYNPSRRLVCSELVARYLKGAGMLDWWQGATPDRIAEVIQRWRDWEIVWEGKLP